MKFGYTIIYVLDVGQTLDFYEAAFGFQRKFLSPAGDYGELETGSVTLAFASRELALANFHDGVAMSSNEQQPLGVEVAFTTDDVHRDFARALKAGAIEVAPPMEKPWGQTVGYVRDLNGFLVELCTPVPS